MDQNLDSKTQFLDKINYFYNRNKIKILFFLITILILIISLAIFNQINERKNNLISEKYIKANVLLSANKIEDAKNIYEEIILSKNNFYSILALNTILEKELINDKNKIMNYFEVLEKTNLSSEQKDLINFKKALYFFKTTDVKSGEELLKKLIDKNSRLKSLAQEIIVK